MAVPQDPLDDLGWDRRPDGLTNEDEAATADPGRPTRTYAPHSQRVPKDPQPGHEAMAAGGSGGEGVDTLPDVPIEGADRSLPEEIRPESLP
jgi:hypothetical protein